MYTMKGVTLESHGQPWSIVNLSFFCQASFEYAFKPHESFGGRPFGLTVNLVYKDSVRYYHILTSVKEELKPKVTPFLNCNF